MLKPTSSYNSPCSIGGPAKSCGNEWSASIAQFHGAVQTARRVVKSVHKHSRIWYKLDHAIMDSSHQLTELTRSCDVRQFANCLSRLQTAWPVCKLSENPGNLQTAWVFRQFVNCLNQTSQFANCLSFHVACNNMITQIWLSCVKLCWYMVNCCISGWWTPPNYGRQIWAFGPNLPKRALAPLSFWPPRTVNWIRQWKSNPITCQHESR